MPKSSKLTHRLARTWVMLGVAATAFACGNDQSTNPMSPLVNPSGTVASVQVAPGTLTATVGDSSQYTAIVKDAQGKVLTNQSVTWSSSDASIVRIDTRGFSTAVGEGTAKLYARTGGMQGFAETVVTAVRFGGVPKPGTVTDLAVSSVTDSSATIAFTEVGDGQDHFAYYQFRSAAGSIDWSTAATVTRDCGSPLVGVRVGNRLSCTVKGLSATTAYDFQLRAYRLSGSKDTVFGGLSNVGKAVTAAVAAAAVASVSVTPGTSSKDVGQNSQYAVVLKDAAGNVLTGRPVTWTSSNTSVVTVESSGLAHGVAAGTANIVASAEGKSASAAMTVTAPVINNAWSNEPTGLTMATDQPFNSMTNLGWYVTNNAQGLMSVASDATAPFSGSSVLQFRYPAGYTGGGAPGTLYFPLAASKEIYSGFYWKPSSPWQNHPSNVNKIAFMQTEAWGNNIDIQMYGPGPYYLHVVPVMADGMVRLTPNVNATPVALGQWHKIEWHLKYATTSSSRNGVVEWWMDGVLQGRYTNLQTPNDNGVIEYQFSPTWGGIDGLKNESDLFSYDHVKISRR